MILSVLASGSSGNCVFIKTESCNILVDVGTNITYLKRQLLELNVTFDKIDYIFISHIHTDHTSSLKQIIKHFNPTVCLGEKMYENIDYLKDYDNIVFYGQDMLIDKLKVELIKTSHDVSDSRGFIFTENEKSVVCITDTGYLNSKYFDVLANRDAYVFESNHDIEMLINGTYPKWLQNRILSDVGHLSNSASSYYLTRLIGPRTKKIVLAHLSRDNNDEQIAYDTLMSSLRENNIEFSDVIIAKPDKQTGVIEI